MNITLTTKLVMNENGLVDVVRSTEVFEKELANFKFQKELEGVEIAKAVHAQFGAYPGCRQNLPAIISGAMGRMNIHPDQHRSMSEKIDAYIRANADVAADEKKGIVGEAPRTRLFSSIKKKVGMIRWSDVTEVKE